MEREDSNALDSELMRVIRKFDSELDYAENHMTDPSVVEDLKARRQVHYDRLLTGRDRSDDREEAL